jgi:hypothetical protein
MNKLCAGNVSIKEKPTIQVVCKWCGGKKNQLFLVVASCWPSCWRVEAEPVGPCKSSPQKQTSTQPKTECLFYLASPTGFEPVLPA